MNIQVPLEKFNLVKSSFLDMDIDTSMIDDYIKPVLKRLQTSPLLSTICPRWSCEGHDETFRNSDYEIIFCNIGDDSADILDELFEEISKEYHNITGECVSVLLRVVNLAYGDYNFDKIYKHISINITTCGDSTRLKNSVTVWLKALDTIEQKYK